MTRMNARHSRFVGTLLCAGFLTLAGCQGESLPAEEAAVEVPVPESMTELQLSPVAIASGGILSEVVTRRSLEESMAATGRVQINQDTSARVGAFAEGRVTRVDVTIGDRVEAGQPIVWIHSHELIDARAAYSRALTSLSLAQRDLSYTRAEAVRADRLLEAKAISVREQLQAAADVVAAEAQLEQARTEVERAGEFIHHLGVEPDSPQGEESGDVVVRSPITGVVMERSVTIGSVVSPAEDLMTISDLTTLWVVAEVPEQRSSFVKMGQSVQISVPAFPDVGFDGRVVYIGESLDPAYRTVSVRCLVRDVSGRLRPEMYATIDVGLGQTPSLLAVAAGAVQEIEGESVVFIDHNDGRFEKRVVRIGRSQDGMTEITTGLREGERIVTDGAFLIKTEFLKGTIVD